MDRYDNFETIIDSEARTLVVEAYRLDRYDNFKSKYSSILLQVVEAYRLDRYDNFDLIFRSI